MPTPPENAWKLFWAKTDRHNDYKKHGKAWTHPLWAHLLDVASAAEALWAAAVPPPLKDAVREATGLDEPAHVLSLWIGLHDIGKAIPGFQHRHDPTWETLARKGLTDREPAEFRKQSHGYASVPILRSWMAERGFSPKTQSVLSPMALFIGFHHGRLCRDSKVSLLLGVGALGEAPWAAARRRLIEVLVEVWEVERWPEPAAEVDPWAPWLFGFAGWTALADWVGSMTDSFPDASKYLSTGQPDLRRYACDARNRATELIHRLKLDRPAHIAEAKFQKLFPQIEAPHEVQRRVQDLQLPTPSQPTLTIIEAPTGEGKTEAAFALAARQQQARRGSGIYVAMPTMATSNGLFPRFERFVRRAHAAGSEAPITLVHGTADLHPDYQKLFSEDRAPDVTDIEDADSGGGSVWASRWFLPKKRGLLAPYGIGTVDQTLLGVLRSKHFFLRLFGLTGKTIIFDEVHAYDAYMSALFERLLRWLRALDVNVILLSATLPAAARARLLKAWGASDEEAHQPADYPALWHVADGELELQEGFDTQMAKAERVVKLEWRPSDREKLDVIIAEVQRATKTGAAVAVIVNEVDRAQKLYRRLTSGPDALDLHEDDVHLLHARFPLDERYQRELAALKRFGKTQKEGDEDETPRPVGPAVLVATQVAEQSLDLDFDVMLSDLAPVDLLLQRAGRVHRHALPYPRPGRYAAPRLFILCPEPDESGLPDVFEVGYVYDTLTLLQTWYVLQGYEQWTLPGDYRDLIDGVYVDHMMTLPVPNAVRGNEAGAARWEEAKQAHKDEQNTFREAAKLRAIQKPERVKRIVNEAPEVLYDEEDPEAHEKLKALTRYGPPSINLVCLYDVGGRRYLEPAGEEEALPARFKEGTFVRDLLKRSVRVSQKDVVRYFKSWSEPWWASAVKQAPALYFHRPIVFTRDDDGEPQATWTCRIDGRLTLRLDSELGLVYEGTGGRGAGGS